MKDKKKKARQLEREPYNEPIKQGKDKHCADQAESLLEKEKKKHNQARASAKQNRSEEQTTTNDTHTNTTDNNHTHTQNSKLP